MIVHDEEEWRQLNRSFLLGRLRKSLIPLAILAVVGFAFFGVMGVAIGIPLAAAFVTLLILGLFTLFIVAVMLTVALWQVERHPAWGLYEKGIQINQFLFVPFREIGRVSPREPKGVFKGTVGLVPRTPLQGLTRWNHGTMVRVQHDMLGEEGVAELLRRVSGTAPEQGPPRLVLYGPRSRR
jgi:hypothetical protein